ncbi:gp436 family protein [Caloranaerobacter sp. DY30410]|uniref:gp436 family protein n=1 Tax=Caloranaerobacter sp. DY30410 TaxID=3238305 RepID=UPI003CFFDAB2
MSYCTVEEVRKVLRDEAINKIVADEYIEDETQREAMLIPIIEEAIKDADGEIDGYLNKRYSTPLPSPVPRIISKLSKDIAVYNIFSRIGIDEEDREKTVLTRYRNAIKFLENVARGIIDIGTQKIETRAKNSFVVNANTRLFSRDSLKGM